MVLADSSVWSLALRRKKSKTLNSDEQRLVQLLSEASADGRVAMIGPIRQEVLSGIRHQAQFDNLKATLRQFPDHFIETEDYEEAAKVYNAFRARGLQCGTIDILICALALRRNWEVLSNDSGLNHCLQAIARLKS